MVGTLTVEVGKRGLMVKYTPEINGPVVKGLNVIGGGGPDMG